jgi:hypothetical protein
MTTETPRIRLLREAATLWHIDDRMFSGAADGFGIGDTWPHTAPFRRLAIIGVTNSVLQLWKPGDGDAAFDEALRRVIETQDKVYGALKAMMIEMHHAADPSEEDGDTP